MAVIKVCDRCGKKSPDKNGRHISNHWFDIKSKKVGTLDVHYERKFLLCKNCYNKLVNFIKEG